MDLSGAALMIPGDWSRHGLLQLDFFLVLIEEMKFGQMIAGIGFDPYFLAEFPSPFP